MPGYTMTEDDDQDGYGLCVKDDSGMSGSGGSGMLINFVLLKTSYK